MRLLGHLLLLCATLGVTSARWRHRKKNVINGRRSIMTSQSLLTSQGLPIRDVMRRHPRAHRPIRKSIVHAGEDSTGEGAHEVGEHRYPEVVSANPERREPHNLDKAEKGLFFIYYI